MIFSWLLFPILIQEATFHRGDDVTRLHLRRRDLGFRRHHSLLSVPCFQTPPVASGIPGWGRRTDGLTSPPPETPPTRDPSPSWCRPPPRWRCGTLLQHWHTITAGLSCTDHLFTILSNVAQSETHTHTHGHTHPPHLPEAVVNCAFILGKMKGDEIYNESN